jgi:CBS domain containing-hemolysin-like protein
MLDARANKIEQVVKSERTLKRKARQTVGTHNNCPVHIIPDSDSAPQLLGNMQYVRASRCVVVGENWK